MLQKYSSREEPNTFLRTDLYLSILFVTLVVILSSTDTLLLLREKDRTNADYCIIYFFDLKRYICMLERLHSINFEIKKKKSMTIERIEQTVIWSVCLETLLQPTGTQFKRPQKKKIFLFCAKTFSLFYCIVWNLINFLLTLST